ncbi:mas-related G-protein coupled receptor member H-like [Sceloporus undulatus]|uniref:mas-related G-protein coupled receptor member H-like n=1 Tax=Sceloporus undulatus TaxID=8520 RepID=UPI001C4B1E38|nr:mas-related G-protein coupled receptor member H-like [Sceloporus undulatus]
MIQLSTTPLLPSTYSAAGSQGQSNTTRFPDNEIENSTEIILYLLFSLFLFICIFGLVGNGIVLWYLCFLIKRNPITTYVLHLAAADSGVLLTIVVLALTNDFWFLLCFLITYTSSQYLLTAISTEKCLSVVFPIWYRCHRPKYLSALICTLLWNISCLIIGILFLPINRFLAMEIISITNFILCTPTVIICTVLLFIRIYCSLHGRRQGKFYAALLLILLVFILFGAPFSITLIFVFFSALDELHSEYLWTISVMCASINSSVNPLIYFLIGRKKMQRSRESFKLVLQRVFSDNVDCREGRQPV